MITEPTTEQIATASRYLLETRDALAESTRGLSASQWDFQPAPDCWSIAGIVEHVVVVEKRIRTVVGNMSDASEASGPDQVQVDDFILARVAQRTTKVKAPPQVNPAQRWTGAEAREHFLEGREQTIQLLSAHPLRGRVYPHPLFGPWDGYQWLLAAAAHSARHTSQIGEVKGSPDFPGAATLTPQCVT
jgi:uncharacterized damage-inducible protein DinB